MKIVSVYFLNSDYSFLKREMIRGLNYQSIESKLLRSSKANLKSKSIKAEMKLSRATLSVYVICANID